MSRTDDYYKRRGAERIDELLTFLEVDHPHTPTDAEFTARAQRLANTLRARTERPDATVTSLTDTRRRRGPTRIPGYVALQRAAASDEGPTQRVPVEGWAITFARTLTASDHTRVTITASEDERSAGEVVRIAVADREQRSELLIVLYEESGDLLGQSTTPIFSLPDDLEISVITDVEITPDMAETVTESVRTSSTAPKARNAWRQLARALPRDHPIRQAVVRGLH